MDLKKVAISQSGVWFKPDFVDGSPLDIEFLVVGRNSDAYARIAKKYSAQAMRDKNKFADKIDEMTTDILCACVLDWKSLEMDGQTFACTPENKRTLFGNNEYKWLVSKIDEFIADDSNFLSPAQRLMS
jgi:hypothetical protein